MASTIITKNNTTGTPGVSDLVQGELAINVSNGSLYYGTAGGTAVSQSFTFSNVTAATVNATRLSQGGILMSEIFAPIASPIFTGNVEMPNGSIDHAFLAADAVDGDNIADNAVDTEHIADDAIEEEHIGDGEVKTAAIADAQVTVAKMANLADMKVLGNVSGTAAAPAAVAITNNDALGTSDTVLCTQGNVKAYVDARYAYQYVHFFSISDNDDNWAVPHANGWVAYSNKWNTDVGSNTTTIGDTVTLSRTVAMSGFIVPHDDAILVGFYAMVRNNEADNQSHVGLFHNTYANVGAKTGTSDTWALRAYAAGDKTGGDGNSYMGPCETQDMTRSLALSAGDMIVPAVMEETANKIYYNITVVIKTPIF